MQRLHAAIGAVPATVWWAVLAGIFIHIFGLTFVLGNVGVHGVIVGDGKGYVELARNLAHGVGYGTYNDSGGFDFETFRTPGLPALIALVLSLGFGLAEFLYVISFVSAVVLPLATWYIARTVFDGRTAVLTAWLITLEPFMWIFSWYPFTESLYLIVSLIGAACLVRALERYSVVAAIGAGIFFAAAVYVRPATVPIVGMVLLAVGVFALYTRRRALVGTVSVVAGVMAVAVLPWLLAIHAHTGVWSMSGTGWRNVYTDYLASVRALQKGTGFSTEKAALKQYAYDTWDMTPADLNSPASASTLRGYALPEIVRDWPLVLRLEPMLIVSYFTNADYTARLAALGFIPELKASVSASQAVLHHGLGAIPMIFNDLRERYFLPLFERLWAVAVLLFAAVGYIASRTSARHLFALVIAVGAVTSTAIGLGVEARLRIPILPYYYMLAAFGMLYVNEHANEWWHALRARSVRARA